MVTVALRDARPTTYEPPSREPTRAAPPSDKRQAPALERSEGTSDKRAAGGLSEEILVRLWGGQSFPASALVTTASVPLRVLHPGRRGRGAGPDFRDAIIAPPSGALLRGDVELHRRTSDFRAHGHATDERYDSVILHVVFEDDGAGETALA